MGKGGSSWLGGVQIRHPVYLDYVGKIKVGTIIMNDRRSIHQQWLLLNRLSSYHNVLIALVTGFINDIGG